ncbi:MAG: GTPase family protein [Oscillospiraceae bacterium]
MSEQNRLFETVEKDINNSTTISEEEKVKLLTKVHNLRDRKINLMITGATGCGKSSTINALFDSEVAKVGQGADPETMKITRYELNNLVIWDSPGLGDGKENDIEHSKKIIQKLNECDEDGNALIDLVLVIIDGSTRDMGTSYQLINEVIIPNLGENKKDRILVAINKCDGAMSGRHWIYSENRPDEKLVDFLKEKVMSVHDRIYEATGVDIEPIYYAAGFKEDDDEQKPYNLSKLLYFIIQHTPKEKRLVYATNMSKEPDVWKSDDELQDYREEIRHSFMEAFVDSISEGADYGEQIGEALFGTSGAFLGKFVGGVVGGVGQILKEGTEAIKSGFNWFKEHLPF